MKTVAAMRQNKYDSTPTIIQFKYYIIFAVCLFSILDHTYSCLNWHATSNAKIVCMYVATYMHVHVRR